jgi:hypothetical protein
VLTVDKFDKLPEFVDMATLVDGNQEGLDLLRKSLKSAQVLVAQVI